VVGPMPTMPFLRHFFFCFYVSNVVKNRKRAKTCQEGGFFPPRPRSFQAIGEAKILSYNVRFVGVVHFGACTDIGLLTTAWFSSYR